MTKPNIELAERVMQHIEAHLDEWDQGNWVSTVCRTTMCFAGTVLHLSGYAIDRDHGCFVDGYNSPIDAGSVPHIAADLLGVPKYRLDPVFHLYTSQTDALREKVEDVMRDACRDHDRFERLRQQAGIE